MTLPNEQRRVKSGDPLTHRIEVARFFPAAEKRLFHSNMGEFLKPAYGFSVDPGGAVLYLGITALFLLAAGLYLARMRVDRPAN